MNQSDDQKTRTTPSLDVETRPTRHGGITYPFLPAVDVHQSAAFYEQIFGWKIHGRDTNHLSFDDRTGHLSGA
jgi:uncharacterized protein